MQRSRGRAHWTTGWLGVLMLGVWLVGCGPAGMGATQGTEAPAGVTVTPARPITLEGTEWLLASLHGAGPLKGTRPTVSFHADDYMEGSAGCNTFGIDYVIKGEAFEVPVIHRTRFECGEPTGIAEWEVDFFGALASIAAYRATEDRLEFDDADGETILTYERKRPATVDAALQGTGWTLTSMRGTAPIDGTALTLSLSPEGFEGYAGCNHFGGEYEAAGEGVLDFGVFAITQIDCPSPEGVIEQEEAFVQTLGEVAGYRLEGDRLELLDAGGETIVAYARQEAGKGDAVDLVGTVWQLVSMNGQSPVEGSRITLAFHDEQLASGSAGCRDYVATYRAKDSHLGFEYMGMLGEGCPQEGTDQVAEDRLMEQEGQYTTMLGWTNRFRLGGGQLELHTVRDETITFKPLPGEDQASLEGPTWHMLAFVEANPYMGEPDAAALPPPMPAPVLPGTEITALFEEGSIRGSAGCNDYGAAAQYDEDSIEVSDVVATEKACLDPKGAEYPEGSIMKQEARTLEFLQAASHYAVYGQQLWLKTDDGRALVFGAQE